MSSLSERRRRETRNEIAATAVELFARDGYETTTVEEVATAAGVSRRTAYRHFPLKEDLVFVHGRIWLERFDTELESRQPGEASRDLIRRALLDVADTIEETRDVVLPAWDLAMAHEALRGRIGRFQSDWMERYLAVMTADVGDRPEGLIEAVTMAGTLVGTTNGIVGLWATRRPSADMRELTAAVLERVDPIWPDECRVGPPT